MKSILLINLLALVSSTLGKLDNSGTKTVVIPFEKQFNSNIQSSLEKRASYNSKIFNYLGIAYLAKIDIGTPLQSFNVIIDTGSSDLWILGSNCSDKACSDNRFNGAASSSFKALDTKFDINYMNVHSNGIYATDVVSLGGVSIPEQKFGLAYSTPSIVESLPDSPDSNVKSVDGVLGLGFPSSNDSSVKNQGEYNSFLQNLISQGLIENALFSIYLGPISKNGWSGELILGGTDKSKYKDELIYFSLSNQSSLSNDKKNLKWMIDGAAIEVFASPSTTYSWLLKDHTSFVLDTSSALSYFPKVFSSQILEYFMGDNLRSIDDSTGAYIVKCDVKTKEAELRLKLLPLSNEPRNHVILAIPAQELLIPIKDGNGMCIFAIASLDDSESENNTFVLGDSILRSVYTVFDIENSRIGLATTKDSNSYLATMYGDPINPFRSSAYSVINALQLPKIMLQSSLYVLLLKLVLGLV